MCHRERLFVLIGSERCFQGTCSGSTYQIANGGEVGRASFCFHNNDSHRNTSSGLKSHQSITCYRVDAQRNTLLHCFDSSSRCFSNESGGRYLTCTGVKSTIDTLTINTFTGDMESARCKSAVCESALDVCSSDLYSSFSTKHYSHYKCSPTGNEVMLIGNYQTTEDSKMLPLDPGDSLIIKDEIEIVPCHETVTDQKKVEQSVCYATLNSTNEALLKSIESIDYCFCIDAKLQENSNSYENYSLHRQNLINKKSLCKLILNYLNRSQLFAVICSRMAKRSYLLGGRGGLLLSLKMNSATVERQPIATKSFARFLEEVESSSLVYVHLRELGLESGAKYLTESWKEFRLLCERYDPYRSCVFAVSLDGCLEASCNHLTSQAFDKLACDSNEVANYGFHGSASVMQILEALFESDDPQSSFILTPLPGTGITSGGGISRRAREICFTSIQQRLRKRGVVLRHQYPEIYHRLCAYTDKKVEFAPVCLFPVNQRTGKRFFCTIMPNSEPAYASLKFGVGRLRQEIIV